MDLGLAGKVAIVTGGSEGIGLATARQLVSEGANVVIAARRAGPLADATEELRQLDAGRVISVSADVTVPADLDRVVAAAVDGYGRIDIVVNNAGTALTKPFEEVTSQDWTGDLDLKLWAAVGLIQRAVPELRKAGGGRIVNVTNLSGRTPGKSSLPTSVSRAAGVALTKALSKDLAADNILVNTVCIGYVKSAQHERRFRQQREAEPDLTLAEFYERRARELDIPLGRGGEADEAARVIAFLASEAASYVTGVAVNVDGGASAVV